MQWKQITDCAPLGCSGCSRLNQLADDLCSVRTGNAVAAQVITYQLDRDISDLARSIFRDGNILLIQMSELPFQGRIFFF